MRERGNWPLDYRAAYGSRTFLGGRLPPPADVSIDGLTPEGRNLRLLRPVALALVPGLIGVLNLACASGGTGGAESPPVPTRPLITVTVEPTSTPISTPTVEIPPTPELEFKFGEYDVFLGEVEGGGKVVFAALPNGKLLFQAAKPEVTCDNPKNTLYKFLVAPPYTPGGFNYSSRISIEGTLTSATTVAGQMSNKEHFVNTSDGRIKCSANSFPFTAQRVGKGREAFLDNYKKVMGYPINTMSNKEVEELINRAIKLYGFELP